MGVTLSIEQSPIEVSDTSKSDSLSFIMHKDEIPQLKPSTLKRLVYRYFRGAIRFRTSFLLPAQLWKELALFKPPQQTYLFDEKALTSESR